MMISGAFLLVEIYILLSPVKVAYTVAFLGMSIV